MKHKYVTSKRKPGRPRTSIGRPKINYRQRIDQAECALVAAAAVFGRELRRVFDILEGEEKRKHA